MSECNSCLVYKRIKLYDLISKFMTEEKRVSWRDEYTTDRNNEDCNIELIEQKKGVRESYTKNRDHKAKQKIKYYLCDYRFDTNLKDKSLTHFNFKKTTGRKYKYSCGGYGGRCSMCSRDYKCGKNKRKFEVAELLCLITFI